MKTIDTLVRDIYDVLDHKGGWDATVSQYLAGTLAETIDRRLTPPEEERKGSLRMSNLGQPCNRKLWYHIHEDYDGEELRAPTKLKFLYGDILEDLLISLAKAAGHEVTGEQDTMEIAGIKGHRDCVIDGVTVDVKSASSFSFKKFKDHDLRNNDPFGYISQLSSYVYAARNDPLVKDKKGGAFLVVDKQHGTLCLDYYDLTPEIDTKEVVVEHTKKEVNGPTPPPRAFSPVADGKSGNKKLPMNCSYCDHKHSCWPKLRTFLGSRGPVYLTEVKREPRMKEITDE